jgi:hypothetical protein
VPTDWQNTSRSYDRQKLSSAREAAEALFRPKPQSEDHGVLNAGPTTSSTEEGSGRTPRVFAMPQAPQVRPLPDEKPEPLAPAPAPKRKRAQAERRSTALPASHRNYVEAACVVGMERMSARAARSVASEKEPVTSRVRRPAPGGPRPTTPALA